MQILTQMFQLKYLTSAVRTKDGDKAGRNQTLVRDLVHFNLDLTPNSLKFLTSKMADSDPLDMSPFLRRVRAQSFEIS